MRLTPNFTLREFEVSQIAVRRGIDNRVPPHLLANVKQTAQMLQRIRDWLSAQAGKDVPIHISSGYRCDALEVIVSGRVYGDHKDALAVDWEAPAFGSPYEVCLALKPQMDRLDIGQLINEFPPEGWVHTGVRVPARAINRVITIVATGAVPGVVLPEPRATA